MFKFLIFLILLVGSSLFVTEVFSLEIELQRESEREREAMGWLMPTQHSLQEQFQLIIDRTTLKNKISLGWLSTDQNHISLPKTLENISSNPKIVSFTITNEFACASTKLDKACIIIEIEREGLGDNTPEIIKNTREIIDKTFLAGEGDTILYFEPEFYSATLEQKLTLMNLKRV